MLCMLMLFSASEMWATEITVDVKCEPTGVAKVYVKYETDEDYTENQKTANYLNSSENFNLKYDNLQEGYTFLGWSKGAPSTNASDMVSTDQVATVTVLDSEPTVTYYANFASGSNFTITEDGSISEHGTVTYKVNGTETAPVSGVINAKENDEITLIVTPNTGWIVDVDNVKAESYTTWDAAGARRRSAPDNIQILGDVTLTKSTTAENTWTFTMPAANVQVSATYIPVAAFAPAEPSGTLAPTAAEGVIAGEDKAIIVAGTVANIPETTNPQGTVKYFVTDNKDMTAEQAAKANGWVEALPTAAGYTGSYDDDFQVYVWYYIQAATGYADSEPQRIEVTVLSNLFDLTLNAANAYTIDATQTSKGTVSVKEGTGAAVDKTSAITDEGKLTAIKMGSEVKLEAKPGYKFRKVEVKKAAGTKEVLTYSFDDASHPSGLTAGSRVSFDYSRTSVITNSKFLNAYNNTNGDPNATTVSLGDTDLSGETWTLSFEWAACGGCNSKPDHTTLKAGDATLFDLNGNSNWNTTVTIIYTGSDGSKTLPVPGCDKSNRFTEVVGDQYNTTTYWHHIVVTGSAEGVKMTITNSSTGAAVVEDVVLSETNVNPTSLIIEPCCGGGIGIDALSLTYEE